MPARTVHTIQCTQHIISKPAIYPEQFGQTNHAASSIATNIIATNIAQHMCGLISAGSRTLFSGLSTRVPARSYAGVLPHGSPQTERRLSKANIAGRDLCEEKPTP